MSHEPEPRRSLARRLALYVVLGSIVALPAGCYVVWNNLAYDSGEVWGMGEWIALHREREQFERAYLAAGEDGNAWRAALDVVDPSRADREMGITPLPPLFLPFLPDFRLVTDGAARVASLYEPRGARLVLLADGRAAAPWSSELVREVHRSRDDLAWTLDDPRVEWEPVGERP